MRSSVMSHGMPGWYILSNNQYKRVLVVNKKMNAKIDKEVGKIDMTEY